MRLKGKWSDLSYNFVLFLQEESDEVRSLTGSSLASPRTVVDRRLSNISLLSPTPDEDLQQDFDDSEEVKACSPFSHSSLPSLS